MLWSWTRRSLMQSLQMDPTKSERVSKPLPPSPPQVTPVYLACRLNHSTNSALLLLSHGANPNIVPRYDGSVSTTSTFPFMTDKKNDGSFPRWKRTERKKKRHWQIDRHSINIYNQITSPVISKFPIPTQKNVEDSADGTAEIEDKTSVTDLFLVQKRYVPDAGPQRTSFGPKILRHWNDWIFTQYFFPGKNIGMVLEFVLQWFSFNSMLFAEKINKLALISKGGLTLVMAAEHRTKGNIWEALFCKILYFSLSTFL